MISKYTCIYKYIHIQPFPPLPLKNRMKYAVGAWIGFPNWLALETCKRQPMLWSHSIFPSAYSDILQRVMILNMLQQSLQYLSRRLLSNRSVFLKLDHSCCVAAMAHDSGHCHSHLGHDPTTMNHLSLSTPECMMLWLLSQNFSFSFFHISLSLLSWSFPSIGNAAPTIVAWLPYCPQRKIWRVSRQILFFVDNTKMPSHLYSGTPI